MRFRRQGNVMTVDLHGLYEAAAQDLLLSWLDHAPESVAELRVIHGCNQCAAPCGTRESRAGFPL